MKLLFDENLSYKLARSLADLFPDSAQLRTGERYWSRHSVAIFMKSISKRTKKRLTEGEIDSLVESQAGDDSAWGKPNHHRPVALAVRSK